MVASRSFRLSSTLRYSVCDRAPPLSDPTEQPRIEDARFLLRVARRLSDIDEQTNWLSKGAIPLVDLKGQPDSRDQKPRSMSTMMLCNQPLATLLGVAVRLSRSPELQAAPRGAAAAITDIEGIEFLGRPAFAIEVEDEPGQPGHVSIRLAQPARESPDTNQRDLRDALVRAFGPVQLVSALWEARCPPP
jgi:hypothetical protein